MHMRHALHVFIYLLSTPTYLHVSLSSFISGTIKLKSMKIVKAVKRMKKWKGTLKILEGCKNVKAEGGRKAPHQISTGIGAKPFLSKGLELSPHPLDFQTFL